MAFDITGVYEKDGLVQLGSFFVNITVSIERGVRVFILNVS